MTITDVVPNNRRKAFEVKVGNKVLDLPYARLRVKPDPDDRVASVGPDAETGRQAFTYALESGRGDTVPLDAVLDYHRDPAYMRSLLLYQLTLEAQRRLGASGLGKRALTRRLCTSPAQLYRLLDQTNQSKSVDQMLALLHALGCEVEVTVRP